MIEWRKTIALRSPGPHSQLFFTDERSSEASLFLRDSFVHMRQFTSHHSPYVLC